MLEYHFQTFRIAKGIYTNIYNNTGWIRSTTGKIALVLLQLFQCSFANRSKLNYHNLI